MPSGSVIVAIVSGVTCTIRVVLPVTSLKIAEIVVVPGLIAVARPELLMVDTSAFDEVHVAWLVIPWVLPFE
jgi:hypothetical protein